MEENGERKRRVNVEKDTELNIDSDSMISIRPQQGKTVLNSSFTDICYKASNILFFLYKL